MADKADKPPGFYVFAGDYLASEVRVCSYEAKGLWFEMLLHMCLAKIPGVLPGELHELAAALGVPHVARESWSQACKGAISELEKADVFSRGVNESKDVLLARDIVNRRMYRKYLAEFDLSEKRRDAGRKGGLKKAKQTEAKAGKIQPKAKQSSKQTGGKMEAAEPITQQRDTPTLAEANPSKAPAKECQDSTLLNHTLPYQAQPTPSDLEEKRSIHAVREPSELTGVGAILPDVNPEPDGGSISELLRRIQVVTCDSTEWMRRWAKVVRIMAQEDGGFVFLEGTVNYALDCSDEATRDTKGLGELPNPGRWIYVQVKGWAHLHHITLPPPVEERGPDA